MYANIVLPKTQTANFLSQSHNSQKKSLNFVGGMLFKTELISTIRFVPTFLDIKHYSNLLYILIYIVTPKLQTFQQKNNVQFYT